ncbi:MAG: hypothetical protein IJ298_09645 [Ruminococcus sp.]|nr:hypothetical protein [Ruminococcus sp.]
MLKLAVQLLERASGYVSQALDAEQDCLDNMPENLQSSERYEKMEAAIDSLEAAIESIDSAKESIEDASA